MFNWIDKLPLKALFVVAIFFALAPLQPEPHLIEKLRMLSEGALLITLLAAPLEASDVSDAINAMRAGNFAEAYCVLKPYAESGDAEAQYNIGWMYLNGYGLMMNDSKALEWWRRASDQG